ncbi:MAG: cobalamin B12-binding domain-containing protein, partial [Candidatus Odinarchaeia archaeon]
MSEDWVNRIVEAIISLDEDRLIEEVKNTLDSGVSALEIIKKAITKGLNIVGEKYEKGEFFLMHLIAVGDSVKTVMDKYLSPLLVKEGNKQQNSSGTIVIGTVEGDIHDIGKNIVASMLLSAGFNVIDLGKDASCEEFINKAIEYNADIIAVSALLSTTMEEQRKLIEKLKEKNLRDKFKVIVGGAPTSPDWAEEINADGYGKDAIEAVKVVKKLLSNK